MSGLFNGYLTKDPSHHARLPSFANIIVLGGSFEKAGRSGAALNLQNASYTRRMVIPFDEACSSGSK